MWELGYKKAQMNHNIRKVEMLQILCLVNRRTEQ